MEAVVVYLRYYPSSCQQVPRRGAKLFTRLLVKNRNLDLPNRSRIAQLSILRCVKNRVCMYWTVLKALVKKRNLIYMKAESAEQRWSSVSCSLSLIGSHALGKMMEKKKHAEGHEVGSTQTPSGGERVEFTVCPTGAAGRVVYWMLRVCKVENGYSFTVKYQISEMC